MNESFEQMLSGGHHNSLGRTLEVVDLVLADQSRFEELFNCYFSDDELVRLRVSNAVKRVAIANKAWVVPYIDRLLDEVSEIDQASTQWTQAILYGLLGRELKPLQRERALQIMKRNLETHTDWIVLNYTMETLAKWAKVDGALRVYLLPHLERISGDERKSVKKRAEKYLGQLRGI